jgi:hypothetical protein
MLAAAEGEVTGTTVSVAAWLDIPKSVLLTVTA